MIKVDKLSYEDKSHLSNKTDFEVFMSVMNSKEKAKYKVDALLVLTLLFPDFHIKFLQSFHIQNRDILRFLLIDL